MDRHTQREIFLLFHQNEHTFNLEYCERSLLYQLHSELPGQMLQSVLKLDGYFSHTSLTWQLRDDCLYLNLSRVTEQSSFGIARY